MVRGSSARWAGAPAGRAWLALLVAAVTVQLVVLYWPDPPSSGASIPGLDKLVHAAVFAAPALAAVLAGLRPGWTAAALVAHAVVSEVVQDRLLAGRSGDVWDAVADVVGVALGLLVGLGWRRRARRRSIAEDPERRSSDLGRPGPSVQP